MLDHIRTLDPGQLFRTVFTASAEYGIDYILGFAHLESVVLNITPKQGLRFTYLLEGGLIQLHNLERHYLRPAEIHIEAAVVIDEQVGIAITVT
ncbi:MAG: hypothetical protein BWY95_02013 [Bacteroidetes bacterium ADurb.BinA104]|nr:MAG: hypothetical protein BWY95_02013 [Bacteroidetes bacterium ADurb.BinA104]